MFGRMATLYVKPDKVDEMNTLFQEMILPLMKKQAGFKGIFILNKPGEHKEICLTLWENMIDMETFNIRYMSLKDEIVPLLTLAPEIEIFHVVVPEDAEPPGLTMSESSLGIRIQSPFDYDLTVEKV